MLETFSDNFEINDKCKKKYCFHLHFLLFKLAFKSNRTIYVDFIFYLCKNLKEKFFVNDFCCC